MKTLFDDAEPSPSVEARLTTVEDQLFAVVTVLSRIQNNLSATISVIDRLTELVGKIIDQSGGLQDD